MAQIGAAWNKTDQNGNRYMSVNIEFPGLQIQCALFPNQNKKSENQPDFIVSWNSKKKQNSLISHPTVDENNDPWEI